jgi:hypothetical protein
MPYGSQDAAVRAAMDRINTLWRAGEVDDLKGLIDVDVVTTLPQAGVWVKGRDALLDGFRDFCTTATIGAFREDDRRVEVIGDTAVAASRFEMAYERAGQALVATGRDLWMFERRGDVWIAVCRIMLDLDEKSGG